MLKGVEKKEIKVPAHIDYLGDLRDFVVQIGKKHKFSDKLINAFKLAVDEAATNIIRHSYREKEGLITIRAIVRKNSLTLSVIDQGIYFDPRRVKDPDLKRYIDIGKKGGLGIFIMRKLMDKIDYRKTEEGNELRITKNREPEEKKKNIIKSVSTIPFSIKAKYFFRTLTIVTTVIALGYLYFYVTTDNGIIAEFISSSRLTNKQIVTRISASPADEFEFIDDIVHPIFKEYQGQIYQITVEDSSGVIPYSSNIGDMFNEFYRPEHVQHISVGIYKYRLRNKEVYEFEEPIIIKQTNRVFGKIHVFYTTDVIEAQIHKIRVSYLKLALLIFGISNVGVVLLIYLVMNPFRKLSEWVKNLGTGEIEDEIEIDSGSEIGEIAQAFSGMTQKLRESQKSLADQERLQKEMQVAQEIQQTLLPMEFPHLDGYELSSYYEAAKEVGGDYYDFVEVDKDTLGIAVADVSGKGVPGSLVMTMIRTALRTEARGIKDAAEVLSRVNAFVSGDIKKGMFVTVFYVIVDSRKRRVNYASAGHNPMILYRAATKKTYYLNPKGFPIGVQLPEKNLFKNYIESDTIKLNRDDILLIYTDGITEAMNSARELYGEERLLKVLREHGKLSADEFVEKLKDDIYSFTEGSPQYDDITLVALKEESSVEEDEFRRAKEAHALITSGMSMKEACDRVNLATYAYRNKYKKAFEEAGVDSFEIDQTTSVEAKHISIEDKTKMFDVIANNPEYGAARIKDELNTEKYNFCQLTETQIYEELVRSRLNTRQLREAYIERTRKNRMRLKPPGTPLLTLDGQLIINKTDEIINQISAPEKQTMVGEDDQSDVESTLTTGSEEILSSEKSSSPEDRHSLEADVLLDGPLEDVLQQEAEEESATIPSEGDMSESVADTGDTFEALMADSFSEHEETLSESDVAADDMKTGASDELLSYVDGEKGSDTEEANDFEQLISDTHIEFDERFITEDDSETTSAATAEKSGMDVEVESAAEVPGEEAEVGTDDDQGMMVSSVSELLQNDYQQSLQEDSDIFEGKSESEMADSVPKSTEFRDDNNNIAEHFSEAETELSETDEHGELEYSSEGIAASDELAVDKPTPVSAKNDQELVSFSDLIQAIDDEIVYVKDYEKSEKVQGVAGEHETTQSDSAQQIAERENNNGSGQTAVSLPDKSKENTESRDNRELILIKGIRYYKNNDYENAIREFKKVIDLHPDYKEAHSILGNAYFRNKMYEDAAVAYARVKEIDPTDITAYENMGVIYANLGEYKEAVNEWQTVLELSPDRVDIQEKIQKAIRMMA